MLTCTTEYINEDLTSCVENVFQTFNSGNLLSFTVAFENFT